MILVKKNKDQALGGLQEHQLPLPVQLYFVLETKPPWSPHVPDVSQCCFLLDLISWCCPRHVLTHICAAGSPSSWTHTYGEPWCVPLCWLSAAHQARAILLLQREFGWGWLLWGACLVWGCFSSPALRVSDRPVAAQEPPAWLCT